MHETHKHTLTKKEHNLLLQLFNSPHKQSRKIFDKQDNTFTEKSFREREKITGVSKSQLQRLFDKLKKHDLLRLADTATHERLWMLNPSFMCRNKGEFEKRFMQAMYEQQSHHKALEWAELCRFEHKLIDFSDMSPVEAIDYDTGEVTTSYSSLRDLMPGEAMRWAKERQAYMSTDRTKRYKAAH
ncbi:MarR family transcriptional regulator [Vibrio coralliirubri]|uniref:MarR family transcriptional regulator n=1 Tax=Vibrio coralliirubri TaxID=1516159 RepID=UPI000EFC1BC5|nr:MarR family transcriptional regulator [Vibrio coralliirubri]